MNAVNRLIYETAKQSKPRTTQFHVIREGTMNMAMTSAAERDQRDEIKLRLLLRKTEEQGNTVSNVRLKIRKSEVTSLGLRKAGLVPGYV